MVTSDKLVPVGTLLKVMKEYTNSGYKGGRNDRKVGEVYEVTSIIGPKAIIKNMGDTATVYHLTALKRNGELSKRIVKCGSHGLSHWLNIGIFEIVKQPE